MAGQGAYTDRSAERLDCSDSAIIVWRKILEREIQTINDGWAPKKWSVQPADLVPTFGF